MSRRKAEQLRQAEAAKAEQDYIAKLSARYNQLRSNHNGLEESRRKMQESLRQVEAQLRELEAKRELLLTHLPKVDEEIAKNERLQWKVIEEYNQTGETEQPTEVIDMPERKRAVGRAAVSKEVDIELVTPRINIKGVDELARPTSVVVGGKRVRSSVLRRGR